MESEVSGTLLLVDDDVDMLEVFPPALGSLGARITAVSTGQEALRLVAEHDYAAIILDVNMDQMDGFEAATRIRRVSRRRSTPILFITGDSFDEPRRRRGYSVGAVDYLLKPLDLDVLHAKLGVFLQLDKAHRRVERLNAELTRSVDELVRALANVKTLRGIVPICAYCHRIRDHAQAWQRLEAYVTEHSEATFSHGICPSCFDKTVTADAEGVCVPR